ncbi:phage head spike fiber domain-containing protein [Variovorax sp. AFSI2.2]|uniref:phage head spike fiber domain-containing protein n=1 Tax=Variovorax sp. AFSI2.2 TaxID=3384160 RepID=UPI003EC11C50
MQARATRMGGHRAPTALADVIAGIFASTPASAWYDPSDLSTMYQDNFAQTAVTAVEQPVGFMMDKSKGGAPRGAEVVLNGGFDSGLTSWTTPNAAPGTTTLVGSRVVLDSGAAGSGGTARLRQALTVPIGWYEVTFDISAFSGLAGNAQLALGSDLSGGSQYLAISASTVGTARRVIYVSSTTLGIAFFCGSTTTQTTFTVDNLTIKPISGANLWTGAPTVNNGSWVDNADGSYTNAGNTGTIGYTNRLVIGKTYEAFVRVTARTAGTFYVPYDGVGPNAIIVSTVSTYRRVFTATTTSLYIYSNAFNGTVASVYVQELPTVIPLTQATSTARPVLSARVNLFTKSEKLDDAAWAKAATGTATAPVVTADTAVAPDGTSTADRVVFALNGGTTSNDLSQFSFAASITGVVGGSYTSSIWMKTNDGTTKVFMLVGVAGGLHLISVTPTWQRFSCTEVAVGTSLSPIRVRLRGNEATADSADVSMWGAQFEADPVLGAYQRIDTATDYDWLGWPLYLRTDGTDDGMATGGAGGTVNFDLSGTDKVSVFAGVHKASDAVAGVIAELSASEASNAGTFLLQAPADTTTANYRFDVAGDAPPGTGYRATTFTAPISNVLSMYCDIAGANRTSEIFPRINGALPTLAAAGNSTAGAGNFGSYPLYVGSRAGTSLRFNGRLYSLMVIGRALTPDELFVSERYVGQKMGIAL